MKACGYNLPDYKNFCHILTAYENFFLHNSLSVRHDIFQNYEWQINTTNKI